jgi:DNA-binding NtrC family response regulator
MIQNILLYYASGETFSHLTLPYETSISFTERTSMVHVQRDLLTQKFPLLISRCEFFDSFQREILVFIKKYSLAAQVIFIAKSATVEDAVQAIKLGARDFIVAPSITPKIFDSALPEELRRRVAGTGTSAATQHPPDGEYIMVGETRAINEVRSAISLVTQSTAAVLITGESGTGKEIVARLIHQEGDRNGQPFVAINCAALPKDVIENELFGHEKGAFTGALIKKQGAFELANNGTIFFDEIAEMNPDTQAKLLRAIESKAFRRLGGNDEVKVDVRVIAATNMKIADAISSGRFREDLYYRFSVIEIDMPPLRDRREDIPLLIDHFMTDLARRYGKQKQSFSEPAMKLMMAYDWPGNVRELRNIIERAIVTRTESVIDSDFLPSRITNSKPFENTITIPVGTSFSEAERILILQTLESVNNNQSKAAKILGLSRKTLHNKLKIFKLN